MATAKSILNFLYKIRFQLDSSKHGYLTVNLLSGKFVFTVEVGCGQIIYITFRKIEIHISINLSVCLNNLDSNLAMVHFVGVDKLHGASIGVKGARQKRMNRVS